MNSELVKTREPTESLNSAYTYNWNPNPKPFEILPLEKQPHEFWICYETDLFKNTTSV